KGPRKRAFFLRAHFCAHKKGRVACATRPVLLACDGAAGRSTALDYRRSVGVDHWAPAPFSGVRSVTVPVSLLRFSAEAVKLEHSALTRTYHLPVPSPRAPAAPVVLTRPAGN